MSDQKKLFLLDAMALVYRAHFAFISNPRITSTGINTSAIFGFMNALLEILEKEKPTHLAVVTDVSGVTFRNDIFPEYKAGREETPEDILAARPYIERLLKAMNIAYLGLDGYEADDIIGTVAKKAQAEGFQVYMMTPDKDFAQLVDENIFHYKPSRPPKPVEILGVPETLAKWDIERIDQVIDVLALMGDKVDNIPGIAGVGEKTAVKLLKQFDTVENLLKNTDQLKGKLKEKVEAGVDSALLSKTLATIVTDVPIEAELESLLVEDYNEEELKALFTELEFKTMGKRLFGQPVAASSGQMDMFSGSPSENDTNAIKTFDSGSVDYTFIDSDSEAEKLGKQLLESDCFAFDTETSGLDPLTSELVGISFSFGSGNGYYVAINEDNTNWQQRLGYFAPALAAPNILKVGQNLKFDVEVLKCKGLQVAAPIFDTMLAHYLIEPDSRHNMDQLSRTYLNYNPISIETLIGKKGKNQRSMKDLEPAEISNYACEDADITFRLYESLKPELEKLNGKKLHDELETPLVFVLGDMELEGIRINLDGLSDFSKQLGNEILKAEERIYELAGAQFNINSPKQLGEILFDQLKLDPKAKKTKSGQYSTNEEVLSRLAGEHEIIRIVLEYRQDQKLKSTYVDALPTMVNPLTGRVHSSFNQAVAATGRLSSNNPNLQNIPIRTEKGREIRKNFIPRSDDFELFSADYSQVELRLIAHISNDEAMINDFNEGHDIHSATAARVYGVPISEVDSDLRRNAKTTNFGIIYGISAHGLSQRLGIGRSEAKEIIDQYFEKYQGIKAYMEDSVEYARKHGFVETLMGRRRYLRDINSSNHTVRSFAERNAINAPIQGSAADLIKVAMINIHKEMVQKGLRSKMILQVHDELVFDAHKDEKDELQALVSKKMSGAMSLNVPLLVESSFGQNWLEAH